MPLSKVPEDCFIRSVKRLLNLVVGILLGSSGIYFDHLIEQLHCV